ncbi:hypothetical protein E4U61_005956 [Claviceps capensis]|nr:hypothetical protein E4U61_005956 [Claviceps capensis]
MKDFKESIKKADPRTIEEHMRCFRKSVELGGSVNPEGDSVLVLAVKFYALSPVNHPIMRHLIYFLLDHHADMHASGRSGRHNTDAVIEILQAVVFLHREDTPAQRLPKDLLSDLVDRGLNLTIPEPGWLSPLYIVLDHDKMEPNWLFNLLCENGATIHEDEVDSAFLPSLV